MSDSDPDTSRLFETFRESSLSGKRGIVTGAASGIGRAIALAFAMAGAELAVTDVEQDGLSQTAAMIEEQTTRAPAASLVADLAGEDPAEAVIEPAVELLGGLTTLVNCAGIGRSGSAEGPESPADWQRVVSIDLDAVFLLSRAAMPHLRSSAGGAIVNVASIIARRNYRARGEVFSYPAAKAGVIALTRSMAYTYGLDHVRVNSISPGLIMTPLARPFAARAEEMTARGEGVPIGRVGLPADIAGLALFLASDASSYITGVDITVDGGMTLEVGMDRLFASDVAS